MHDLNSQPYSFKKRLLYFQIWKSKKVISCFSQLPLDMLQPETTSNTRNVTKIKVLCKLIWTDREQKVKAFVFHCEFMSLLPLILLLYEGIITVPKKKLYFQRTFSSISMYNHQWLQLMIIFRILGWTSGTNFIAKKKRLEALPIHWTTLEKHSKTLEKHFKTLKTIACVWRKTL